MKRSNMFFKKNTVKLLLAVLAAAMILPVTASQQRVLVYSDHEPFGGMRTRFLQEVLFPAIEKESQGRLKIEAHWNGELAQAYSALGAVKEGKTADMATTVPEYTAKEMPLHQIFKSFIAGPSDRKQVEFFRRVYAEIPEFSAELRNNNLMEVFSSTGFPVAFYSTEPISGLEGIKNHKWRSASFWHLDYLRNAGAEPVTMHWGNEVYEALENGTLDGLMVNVDSGYNLKVYEHAPNVLVSKDLWLGHLYPVVMNLDTWNSLAEEDRMAVRRAAEKAYGSLGKVMKKSLKEQIKELKKEGANVRFLSAKEVAAFREETRYREVQDKWVKEQEGNGVKNAGDVMKKVNDIMKEYLK